MVRGRLIAAAVAACLVCPAAGHTNAVGIVAVANSDANKKDVTILFGCYHNSASECGPQGALALYSLDAGASDHTVIADYNTEQFGQGGATSSTTYPMVSPANVGSVNWASASHTANTRWTTTELTNAGFTVNSNTGSALMLGVFGTSGNERTFKFHQSTIVGVPKDTYFRPDYDNNPSGQTGKSSLGNDFKPCTTGCPGFDMAGLRFVVNGAGQIKHYPQ